MGLWSPNVPNFILVQTKSLFTPQACKQEECAHIHVTFIWAQSVSVGKL